VNCAPGETPQKGIARNSRWSETLPGLRGAACGVPRTEVSGPPLPEAAVRAAQRAANDCAISMLPTAFCRRANGTPPHLFFAAEIRSGPIGFAEKSHLCKNTLHRTAG